MNIGIYGIALPIENLDQLISVAQANGVAITGVTYSIGGVKDSTEEGDETTQNTYSSYAEAQMGLNRLLSQKQSCG